MDRRFRRRFDGVTPHRAHRCGAALALCLAFAGCSPDDDAGVDTDDTERIEANDAAPVDIDDDAAAADTDVVEDAPPGPSPEGEAADPEVEVSTDDASVISILFPALLECGAEAAVSVTMENVGTTTWSTQTHRLVPVGPARQFYDRARVRLGRETVVGPGESHVFEFVVTAPEIAADHLLTWQMRSETGRFGAPAEVEVGVSCPSDTGQEEEEEEEEEEVAPDQFPPPVAADFANVTWIHQDVSGWAETVTLTATKGPADQIRIANDGTTCGAGDVCWPTFNPSYVAPGEPYFDEFVGGVWIFVYRGDRWVAGLFDSILRDQQVVWDHNLIPGSGWPGGALDGFRPQSGERYGWMISSAVPALSTTTTVNERSNVSEFVWP